jgi:hypothetical protein
MQCSGIFCFTKSVSKHTVKYGWPGELIIKHTENNNYSKMALSFQADGKSNAPIAIAMCCCLNLTKSNSPAESYSPLSRILLTALHLVPEALILVGWALKSCFFMPSRVSGYWVVSVTTFAPEPLCSYAS